MRDTGDMKKSVTINPNRSTPTNTNGNRVTMSGQVDILGTGDKEKPVESSPAPKPTTGASVAINRYKLNYGIPSKKSVLNVTEHNHGADSWQTKAHRFFGQKWVEYGLLGLLCLDILIIFTEMYLLSEYPACRLITRDCISCCPSNGTDDHGLERWLAVDAHHDDHFCYDGYEETGTPACDDHKYWVVHKVEHVLFYITVVILVIFFVENLVEMAALGVVKFFSQLFLVGDFLIVTISLVFEVVFHIMKSKFQEIAAILVLFRLWRFVRVGHALLEVSSEITSKEYECLFKYIKECEEKLDEQDISLPERSDAVHHLIEDHQSHHFDHH